jgi:hypothetical protein
VADRVGVGVVLAGVNRLAERGLGPGDDPPVGEQLLVVVPDVAALCPDRDDDLLLLVLGYVTEEGVVSTRLRESLSVQLCDVGLF